MFYDDFLLLFVMLLPPDVIGTGDSNAHINSLLVEELSLKPWWESDTSLSCNSERDFTTAPLYPGSLRTSSTDTVAWLLSLDKVIR